MISKLHKVFMNPKWTLKRVKEKYLILPEYDRRHLSSLKKLLQDNGYDLNDYNETVDELSNFTSIHELVNHQFEDAVLPDRFPPDRYGWGALLFFLIRKTKPSVVVETGCWYGKSSTIILAGLHSNNVGKLYTIDLPALYETGGYYDENPYLNETDRTSSLPKGKMPGFIVPEFLKNRWELIIGPSLEKLPPLLQKLGKVDLFLHDSLHSYENMRFEFNLAYQYIEKGGFLASDNIDWNTLFLEFSRGKKAYTYLAYYESMLLKDNFGIIVKN